VGVNQNVMSWGWFNDTDVSIHFEAICLWGWVDDSPAPAEPSRINSDIYVKQTEQKPMEIRRAIMKVNEVFRGHFSRDSEVVASVAQAQGGETLGAAVNLVTTVANTNDSVTLPDPDDIWKVMIVNSGANTMQVFPDSGATIDGGAANAAVTQVSGNTTIYVSADGTNWRTM